MLVGAMAPHSYLHLAVAVCDQYFVNGPTLIAAIYPALVLCIPKQHLREIDETRMGDNKALHTVLIELLLAELSMTSRLLAHR